MTKMKVTPKGNSYWNSNGAYQSEYNGIYDLLVPARGKAQTIHGELLRCASRLSYDYYNNGNGNVINEVDIKCDRCYGDGCDFCDEGVESCEYQISEYYYDMIEFLQENLNEKYPLICLVDFLEEYGHHCLFTEEEEQIYSLIMDNVMFQILTTKNEQLNEK